MKTRTARRFTIAAMLLAAGGLAAGAMADPAFTTINNTSGEVSQAQLFSVIYGGSWTLISGTRNYTNGLLTATRAADGGMAAGLDLLGGDLLKGQDDVWSGGMATVTAKAKYAGDSHTFGWISNAPGFSSLYQPILSSTNFNSPVTVELSSSFRWALKDLTTGELSTSRPSDNLGGIDQMATYSLTGKGVQSPTWLLVWEDRLTGADRDFNDSVIELVSVPTPGTTLLSAMGMGLIAVRRRRSPG